MTTSLNNSEVRAEQAASTKVQTLKLGLDIHADSIVVVRILEHSAPQPAQKFGLPRFREWVQTQLALAQQVHSCYEAGPFGYGLHRQLVKMGIHNVVVQPVCLDEHHKGVNHDKSDAKELALRLDRYVAGNTHALATVRVPTAEEEQKRIHSRPREQLRREVQRLAAQGRGLLLTQGHREKRSWWTKRRWEDLCSKLPPWLIPSVTREWRNAPRSVTRFFLRTFQRVTANGKKELSCWLRTNGRRRGFPSIIL